jgi:hypothetical protein
VSCDPENWQSTNDLAEFPGPRLQRYPPLLVVLVPVVDRAVIQFRGPAAADPTRWRTRFCRISRNLRKRSQAAASSRSSRRAWAFERGRSARHRSATSESFAVRHYASRRVANRAASVAPTIFLTISRILIAGPPRFASLLAISLQRRRASASNFTSAASLRRPADRTDGLSALRGKSRSALDFHVLDHIAGIAANLTGAIWNMGTPLSGPLANPSTL